MAFPPAQERATSLLTLTKMILSINKFVNSPVLPALNLTLGSSRASIRAMCKGNNNERVQPSNPVVAEALRCISAHGYPITEQRRTLVWFIMSWSKVFTPDDLLGALESESIRIGRATVFRTLELMERLCYLSRVPNGGHLAYATCIDDLDHHHHLVCTSCGQVLHFEDCPVSDLLTELQTRTGYQIKAHHLELSGVCPSCQR